ncbi:NAD(P)-binding protein [Lepidopterella palustris CBS 459.81]|uniref:3-dehydrosphinganine reductase n=1 Tax=Lepidopterella palustris CBS 459.81 TaxID=1314670 RepID=A0A8E2JKM6_9PEZI|nr:NAD(P)-binding protein [Lepidopterella palustris CBS 459.81]
MALGLFWASIALLVFLAILSLDIMGFFSRKNHLPVDGRTVLLTGGSTGMGRGLGKLLAQKGANIVIVARDVKKLQAAIEYISAAAKNPQTQRFHFISADVTVEAESTRILEEATAWNNGRVPDIVWANAGAATPGLFLETSLETMRKQMDINYWAAAYLAHATLKVWLYPSAKQPTTTTTSSEKKVSELPRHFIITSSSIAFCNIAGYAPYGPAKAALRSLSDALRSELNLYNGARRPLNPSSTPTAPPAPFDINIHTIYPGTILSPGHELENTTKHAITTILEESDPRQSEDEVARAAMKGLERGDYMIATNWLGQLMRVSSLQGSPRDGLVWDTVGSWVTSIAWLFIWPDMEGKVWKWGRKNGMPALKGE